ncbi:MULTISPECIES: hypothetical protein [Pseudomonas]|uniref:hypothetical protein n=1 Tax=Pseudomonas TaxID=286 RepID=UPI00058B8DEF|nr:hypothetical protein [Pseudomonas massiliensis]
MQSELEKEVLTRLLNAHPKGLGSEILQDFHGAEQVELCIKDLRSRGLIHSPEEGSGKLVFPVKLSAAGVEAANARTDA